MEITYIFSDPEMGSVSFAVERITYTRSREGTASRSVTEMARGCIHPGTGMPVFPLQPRTGSTGTDRPGAS